MKFNWKSLFKTGDTPEIKDSSGVDAIDYDKHVDFYYKNLINSIVLFSFTTEELERLSGPTFDPLFELESEIDYAFVPVCFDTIFRNQLIDESLKSELLEFKKKTDEIPSEIWDWELIDNHDTWIEIRKEANNLLNKLGIDSRKYGDQYTTIYDKDGNVLKHGLKS